MSLNSLSKEQKQYVLLGVLAAGILILLMVFGIKFSMASVESANADLADLTENIEKAEQALSQRERVSKEYKHTVAILKQYIENAPPEKNYYSWATEVVYSKARMVDLEIDSIEEINVPLGKDTATDKEGVRLESYSLRIAAHGGYENTKLFIDYIKQDYPLVRFAGIEIAKGATPDDHDIQIFMQWPFNLGAITRKWESVEEKQRAMDTSDSEIAEGLISKAEPTPPSTRPQLAFVPPPKSPPVIEAHPVSKSRLQNTAAEDPSPEVGGENADARPAGEVVTPARSTETINNPFVQETESVAEVIVPRQNIEEPAEPLMDPSVLPVEPIEENVSETQDVSVPGEMLSITPAEDPVGAGSGLPEIVITTNDVANQQGAEPSQDESLKNTNAILSAYLDGLLEECNDTQ